MLLRNSCANFGQANSERAVARTHNIKIKRNFKNGGINRYTNSGASIKQLSLFKQSCFVSPIFKTSLIPSSLCVILGRPANLKMIARN